MFYVHIIDEKGDFEIIDGELLFLYDNIDSDKLIALSDENYRNYLSNQQHGAKWIDGGFVFDAPKLDLQAQKQQLQQQAWEAIKQKRHDNARGGVFIKSIGKWFHNDDPSRTQYLALQVLPSLPDNLMWKTMDNEFVPMTKALLTEIAMTMLTEEQADFANAEKHRLAMLQSDDPLEYDYSTGWSKTHE